MEVDKILRRGETCLASDIRATEGSVKDLLAATYRNSSATLPTSKKLLLAAARLQACECVADEVRARAVVRGVQQKHPADRYAALFADTKKTLLCRRRTCLATGAGCAAALIGASLQVIFVASLAVTAGLAIAAVVLGAAAVMHWPAGKHLHALASLDVRPTPRWAALEQAVRDCATLTKLQRRGLRRDILRTLGQEASLERALQAGEWLAMLRDQRPYLKRVEHIAARVFPAHPERAMVIVNAATLAELGISGAPMQQTASDSRAADILRDISCTQPFISILNGHGADAAWFRAVRALAFLHPGDVVSMPISQQTLRNAADDGRVNFVRYGYVLHEALARSISMPSQKATLA